MYNQELVQLTTQDVSKAVPVTNSKIIAEKYQVKHKSVTDLIIRNQSSFGEFGKLMRFEIARDDSQRSTSGFILNEGQFYLLVTFMKNTEIAKRAKIEFVKAFLFAKNELLARGNTRHISKHARRSLTDTIKNDMTDGTNSKKFAYSNYTKLIYKRVLGMDVKKAKELRHCKEQDNLRDFLSIEELEQVQKLESDIATYIHISCTTGMDDKQIYQMVKTWLDSEVKND